MSPRSLKLRLLLAAAIAVFAALAAGWFAMSYLFERHVERRVEDDLIARGRDLIAALAQTPGAAPTLSDPRFEAPAGGYYWQISGGVETVRSRSLWDEVLPAVTFSRPDGWSNGEITGPFDQRLIVVARTVRLDATSTPLQIVLAEDHAHVEQSRDEFARELGLFLLLLWAVLAAAAWVQVSLGLKPLEDVRAALGALRRQPSARLSEADYPTEAAPLAQAINDLAAAREQDLERARHSAGDLAHSLKTPLAALAAQSRRAREAGAVDAADGLDRAIEAARQAVERELARTRAAAASGARTDGSAVIAKLIQVIERTSDGARIQFENAVSAENYPLATDVLMEIAGPLLENAARFARTRVRVSGDGAVLAIEDDGPGLSPRDAEAALERGKRLDERGDGHGLGLAIARDLTEASGGALTLSTSNWGGLRAEVRWPR